jgi:hypothetical protein
VNGAVFLLIALVLSGIGTLVIYLRNRDSSAVDAGVEEFRREMNALAPRDDERKRR